jgi:hypothetical protein
MVAARYIVACLAVLVLAPAAGAKPAQVAAPAHLHGFLLRTDEPADTSFPRTPAFAWNPVAGAVRYQFQLATSSSFRENAIVYSAKGLTTPVAAPTTTLPWINDMLHARVRAITSDTVTPWSAPFNFDVEPDAVPKPLSAFPGLLRWTPVEGADGYQVWLVDVAPAKTETVYTNVLDEREFYAFHRTTSWMGTVRWRIRALRKDRDAKLRQNGLPAVGYGPWSPVYSSTNPAFTGGPIQLLGTESDVVSTPAAQVAHKLMPGFAFTGDQTLTGESAEFFRVKVFTDRACLNTVYTSPVVGGPAYAPRPFGGLAMPGSPQAISSARAGYLSDVTDRTQPQPPSYTQDFEPIADNESLPGATPTTAVPDDSDIDPGGEAAPDPAAPTQVTVGGDLGAPVDLWDTRDDGGYWWTVVAVDAASPGALSTTLTAAAPVGATTIQVVSSLGFVKGDVLSIGDPLDLETVSVLSTNGSTITLAAGLKNAHALGEVAERSGSAVEYRELEMAQDVCAAGRVARVAKNSEATLAAAGELFATGLSSRGKLISAARKTSFYGSPLVAWTPALGASVYEVQWSKTGSPFKPEQNPQNANARGTLTLGTAAVLPLTPGAWYYRVRGFNYSLPTNAQQMSWSNVAKIVVAKPQFKVVGGGKK